MRARVMSILGITFRGVPAFGALVQGGIASASTLATPIILAGLLAIGVWLQLNYYIRRRGLAEAAERASIKS